MRRPLSPSRLYTWVLDTLGATDFGPLFKKETELGCNEKDSTQIASSAPLAGLKLDNGHCIYLSSAMAS